MAAGNRGQKTAKAKSNTLKTRFFKSLPVNPIFVPFSFCLARESEIFFRFLCLLCLKPETFSFAALFTIPETGEIFFRLYFCPIKSGEFCSVFLFVIPEIRRV